MSKQPSSERRSFLTRLNVGVASLAIGLGRSASAQVKSATPTRFEPARHEKDDWMDEIPGKHRLIFDTVYPAGLGDALLFATNFMLVNRNDYGLQNSDMAIILVLRHLSTVFGFNDAMWKKYGEPMAKMAQFEDPKTHAAPEVNTYAAGMLGQLAKQGVQFAVCSSATRRVAGAVAQAVSGKADDINAELIANLVPNARMVPAGIVAMSRAQERGYTLSVSDRMS
jgi:intracellular sulfur oxidation DsrE/DsrF family protein